MAGEMELEASGWRRQREYADAEEVLERGESEDMGGGDCGSQL